MVVIRSIDEDVTPIAGGMSSSLLPQRPSPSVSADSSRAPSYRGTTACSSPRTWSFGEKSIEEESKNLVRPVSFSLLHVLNSPY